MAHQSNTSPFSDVRW